MTRWSKQDFLRRHAEALRERRPMTPPVIRVELLHERCLAARALMLRTEPANGLRHPVSVAIAGDAA